MSEKKAEDKIIMFGFALFWTLVMVFWVYVFTEGFSRYRVENFLFGDGHNLGIGVFILGLTLVPLLIAVAYYFFDSESTKKEDSS